VHGIIVYCAFFQLDAVMSGKYQLLDERKSSSNLESSSSWGLLEADSTSIQHRKQNGITTKIKTILPWVVHAILIVISTILFVLSTRNKQCLCDNASSWFGPFAFAL